MTNNIVKKFSSSEFGQLRVVKDEGGEPWFVARDVCTSLEIKNMSDAVGKLDVDEKGVALTDTPGGKQKTTIVSESGLYALIMRSRKPEAHKFQRWVTHEVLPSIRRDGGYMTVPENETPEQTMARALLIANEALKKKEARISELEPKALFAETVSASNSTCLVGELAKMICQNGHSIGQNRLFEWLRENGYLGKSGCNRNVPTQRAIEQGLFRIKETTVTHSDGRVTISRTPKVTGKGQVYFVEKFTSEHGGDL